ncbi:hypothetical protein I302_104515 [Kwoniella bestiolae CBS 10118]|uniref:Uncharacterized protein n=1 Tax=Kwoniella bestiolae CBS 10118 TaxID=1296100 RepID=A0A1B9GBG2_9TREE|nr:hypothetical protein I302_03221 [Kwoniella bestiolae CBS 10118]OCF28362.1 hypothetical protein I302_03221 [Kwoniella bestiolae CBS 10118]
MSTLKFSEVISCLEKTDPSHPPSFYYALEVVKRYARAKIAKGSGRQLMCRSGKLETLESKFCNLGYQDIFYLTRLHLKLPPSSIQSHLPSPSMTVRQTLLKAGYPLPADTHAGPSRSPSASHLSPNTKNNKNILAGPRRPIDREGRRGSRSLTSSPNPSSTNVSTLRRSSSSRPDIPRSKTHGTIPDLTPKFGSSPNSPGANDTPVIGHGTSKWTPLLAGLGLRTVFDKSHAEPEINLNFNDPFVQCSHGLRTIRRASMELSPSSPVSVEILNLTLTPLDLSGAPHKEDELVPIELMLSESRLDGYEDELVVKEKREVGHLEMDVGYRLPALEMELNIPG